MLSLMSIKSTSALRFYSDTKCTRNLPRSLSNILPKVRKVTLKKNLAKVKLKNQIVDGYITSYRNEFVKHILKIAMTISSRTISKDFHEI